MKILCVALLLFIAPDVKALSSLDSAARDTMLHHRRYGPPLVASIILIEGMGAGLSAYAARPDIYGDKVVGWFYAANAAAMLAGAGIVYFTTNKDLPIPDRVGQGVLMLGIGYGLSRLAVYNLVYADGHSAEHRATRNFIEFNTTYIVPFALELLTESILRKRFPDAKTTFLFSGTQVGIAIKF